MPGGLAQACLSVPLPYNRGIRIMVWVKGTSGWAVLEGKEIRVKNVYRRAGSSGVETEQFQTSCTFVDEKDEPTHTQSSETFAGSAYPSFGKAFLSISFLSREPSDDFWPSYASLKM